MDFSVIQKDLNRALGIVARAVPTRSTLPILNNILIEAGNGSIELTAYDLELGIQMKVPAQVKAKGKMAFPARHIVDIVGWYGPEQEIGFALDDGNLIRIHSGQSKFQLNALTSEDFPLLPEFKEGEFQSFSLETETLASLLRKTVFASGKDSTRSFTSGILFNLAGDEIKLVATDTRRLSLAVAHQEEPFKTEHSALVPRKTMEDLERILALGGTDPVEVTLSENLAAFRFMDVYLISRLMDTSFPDYRRVIPEQTKGSAVVKVNDLERAARAASIMAREKDGRDTVKLETSGEQLVISSNVENLGYSDLKIPAEVEGEALEIAFNYKYLLEPLGHVDTDSIELHYSGSLDPAMFKMPGTESFVYVLMPVRLH
jgi:DNA polymerase-3 subunit beta